MTDYAALIREVRELLTLPTVAQGNWYYFGVHDQDGDGWGVGSSPWTDAVGGETHLFKSYDLDRCLALFISRIGGSNGLVKRLADALAEASGLIPFRAPTCPKCGSKLDCTKLIQKQSRLGATRSYRCPRCHRAWHGPFGRYIQLADGTLQPYRTDA